MKNFSLSTILGLTFGVLLAGYAVFAFTPPTVAPTGGNTLTPINVGAGSQVKSGGLWAASLFADGLVKMGEVSSLPLCDSSVKGGLIFDTTADKPYVCAGAGWKPLDSDNDKDGLVDWIDPNDNSFNPVCSTDNGGQCYLSQGSKNSLDGDLSAGNIKSGVNIFGHTGTYNGDEALVKETSFNFWGGADYRSWDTVASPFTINSGSSYACTYGFIAEPRGSFPYCNTMITRLVCNGAEVYSITAQINQNIVLAQTPIFSASGDTSCTLEMQSTCDSALGLGRAVGACYSTD